jgi:three-Cys-motif partner protein
MPLDQEPRIRNLPRKLWTENKAKLVERYVYYFLQVTHHGTYIDGFAGPQSEQDEAEMWSARLVLELEPRWLRHFYLFELAPEQIRRLRRLKKIHDDERDIRVVPGNVNVQLPKFLAKQPIRDKEATFCLLDQRTFECAWATVEAVARYKPAGVSKIEILYFLPIGWLDRSLSGVGERKLARWWGRPDGHVLDNRSPFDRAQTFCDRFKNHLGYASAKPWPIWERSGGGRIMYYMIHATDHPRAPHLMRAAYVDAVGPMPSPEDVQMSLAGFRP